MILVRLALVVVIALGMALVIRVYRVRRAHPEAGLRTRPVVPAALRDGADRTWVVFTTPYCASCGPVEASLRATDPGARVVRIDATREPVLAGAFGVRRAPTAVLSDADGQVTERLVGAEAVHRWASAQA